MAHAHTDGDSFVHFRKANVIHMGDTGFSGMYPLIDTSSGGSVKGYLDAVAKIISLADDKTVIIPGHDTRPTAHRELMIGINEAWNAVRRASAYATERAVSAW